MRSRIARIWMIWIAVMAVLAAITWVLFMFPLPGFSSGIPTLNDVLEAFADIGVGGTLTVLGVIFLPPILGTYFEIWKARHLEGTAPEPEASRLRDFVARRIAPRIIVTVDPDRFRFEGPGVGEGDALEVATALRVGHDLRLTAMGDEALAPAAAGVLIRPFEASPRHDAPWLHEEPLIQYCRHFLRVAGARSALSLHLAPRPVVTVCKAHTLRSFFRGRETEILDRVFRAAGASVVEFAA